MLHYIIVHLWLQTYCIVPANTHPPNLTVLWFFDVLRVITHHAKFYCSESKVSQLSSHIYRIVPGKCPWVLTAQAPKNEGGRLHRGA